MAKRSGAVGATVVILLVMGLGTAGYASHLEEDDRFCISCHTAPEMAYYERAQQAKAGRQPPVDLSSKHYTEAGAGLPFRCIDCHRGNHTLVDRATTLALGLYDTLVWISGQADPTLGKHTAYAPGLLNTACSRCHTDTLLVTGFENHFHNDLPEAYRAWQAGGQLLPPRQRPATGEEARGLTFYNTTVTCLSCHRAHVRGEESQFYLQQETLVLPACERCHQEVGRGPARLRGS